VKTTQQLNFIVKLQLDLVMPKYFRWFFLLLLINMLTGCFYWIRAYQTYLQMDEFDQNFSITVTDEFSVDFKDPILYSDDFISLAKLQSSATMPLISGKKWRYLFRKVDQKGRVIEPEIKFYFDLSFNSENRLFRWSFSSLFLQIAPADFLEASFRSLGGAEINKGKRQLKANPEAINKINSDLPKKTQVISQLGVPLKVDESNEKKQEIFHYHFLLEAHDIEEGYEDRRLSVVKLYFDKTTQELIKMSGRFAGLKISIDYRKFLDRKQEEIA